MMRKSITSYFNIVWVLTFSTPFFILALFLFRFAPKLQFQILILSAVMYLAVAILHHYQDKTLTLEIVLEYILIAVLALLILQGLII